MLKKERFLVIIGPSGSGKSSLLKMLVGLLITKIWYYVILNNNQYKL